MQVHSQAEIIVPGTPEKTFDAAVAAGMLSRILHAWGVLPGVKSAEIEGGGPVRTGSRRRVTMSDGSIVVEEILAHDAPREHRYRWLTKPKQPVPLVIRSAEARWTFEPSGPGTRIVWNYTFELTSSLATVPGRLFALLFERWMGQGLKRLRAVMSGEAT
ncbi:MAG TPA: SRPBCC family protein [Polyangiaceae bacterium]|nr:SRPBCC family protein [Polyangiaceae bacterium]